MYYSLYNWIGEHEITKIKEICLLRIHKKGRKKMNEMESQNGLFDTFRNAHA